ncbi:hypothetical protein [Holzapfeliella sp. JNUCC 80]
MDHNTKNNKAAIPVKAEYLDSEITQDNFWDIAIAQEQKYGNASLPLIWGNSDADGEKID